MQRRFNNNVVAALDDQGASVVVVGKGVGFGLSPNDPLDPERVDVVYVQASQQKAAAIAEALSQVDTDVLAIARSAVLSAAEFVQLGSPESMLLPIAQHLQAALERARMGERFEFPLIDDVIQLYPAEMAFGRRVVSLTAAKTGVRLSDMEAAAFALHAVSANFSSSRIAKATRLTESIAAVMGVVDKQAHLEGHALSDARARFAVHLRYLMFRLERGEQSAEMNPQVVEALKDTMPRSWDIALAASELLRRSNGYLLSDNETAYLTLHIGRLIDATRRSS